MRYKRMQNTINVPVSPVRQPMGQVCPNAPKKSSVHAQLQNDVVRRRLFADADINNNNGNNNNNLDNNNSKKGHFVAYN
jgi:hypothetical protein